MVGLGMSPLYERDEVALNALSRRSLQPDSLYGQTMKSHEPEFMRMERTYRATLLFVVFALTAVAAVSETFAEEIVGPEGRTISITRDLAYREGDSEAWKLDLAVATNFGGGTHPALVIADGGGWSAGSKSTDVYQKMMVDYARQGYVTINVEYRLTGEAPFPACIEDVKAAVRWLRAHADEYNVDPDRIGAYGHSAGAHLALMLAMAPESALEAFFAKHLKPEL
jgi:acetyl esterase/lipase